MRVIEKKIEWTNWDYTFTNTWEVFSYKKWVRKKMILPKWWVVNLYIWWERIYVDIKELIIKNFIFKNFEWKDFSLKDETRIENRFSVDNLININVKNILFKHIDDLIKICNSHNTSLDEILSKRRIKEFKKPRIECQCFLRNKGYTYEQIAFAFWYKSHAAIMHNIKNNCPYVDKLKYVNLK